ncbi:MAG TPA: T9SS type A sorting domain-containing protein [Bacteroidota bacterium]|nr:T9SS type A sorting domain-containing protein [Bacteroidota bacterium]
MFRVLLFLLIVVACTGAAMAQDVTLSSAITTMAVSPTGQIFAGTPDGVMHSTDNGATWVRLSSGLDDDNVRAAVISNGGVSAKYSFLATQFSIYRSVQTITSVKSRLEGSRPATYQLEQNYPNPFNPSTEIQFSLPHAARVTLKIYDILGQEVATLLDATRQAGKHSATWNANGCASGVYYYRLSSADFTETKKLLLVR